MAVFSFYYITHLALEPCDPAEPEEFVTVCDHSKNRLLMLGLQMVQFPQ